MRQAIADETDNRVKYIVQVRSKLSTQFKYFNHELRIVLLRRSKKVKGFWLYTMKKHYNFSTQACIWFAYIESYIQ